MDPKEQEEKVDFFVVTAHELRTSLTAMKWLFKMLIDGNLGPLNEQQLKLIIQATTANEHMINLVKDTLTVVRTAGSSVPYLSQPVSLQALVEESIKDFTSEAANKGMHIKYNPPYEAPIVIGDAGKLRIAIHNLFENAIKYGRSETDILLDLSIKDGTTNFSVTDSGLPIPEKDTQKIFQKFFRASNTHEHEGVGLGLYASKYIIERHGGNLTFKSSEDGRTTFLISLPLSQLSKES